MLNFKRIYFYNVMRGILCYGHKSKPFDFRLNDTFQFLDDIFTIDNLEFEKHVLFTKNVMILIPYR